jgi:hypothetical protein
LRRADAMRKCLKRSCETISTTPTVSLNLIRAHDACRHCCCGSVRTQVLHTSRLTISMRIIRAVKWCILQPSNSVTWLT